MPGEKFEDVFSEFDDAPLGAASVAQVHRAVLTEKYGGPREVAVKIQRPSIESNLMGDIANLKVIAKQFQDLEALPLDYYTVFAELEKQLGMVRCWMVHRSCDVGLSNRPILRLYFVHRSSILSLVRLPSLVVSIHLFQPVRLTLALHFRGHQHGPHLHISYQIDGWVH